MLGVTGAKFGNSSQGTAGRGSRNTLVVDIRNRSLRKQLVLLETVIFLHNAMAREAYT